MPSKERVQWSQLKVGILAVSAMVITGVLIFLLTSQSNLFGSDFHLTTYMEDSAGMVANDPVRENGILVGYIGSIKLSGSRDPKKTIAIDMVVREQFLDQIPEDSKAAVSSANLLGSKFINITKGLSPRHVAPDGEIQALPTQDIPQLLAQTTVLLDQFQTIIGRVDGLLAVVENGQGNIGKLIKDDSLYNRADEIAAELDQLVKDVKNSNGTISHLLYDDQLYNDIRKPLQQISDMLAQVQAGKGTLGKAMYDPQIYDELRATSTEAKTLLANLNAGKGTAGKVLTDDEAYKQLVALSQKLNTTMDKIDSGQGTIGQLMVNPQLYDSLIGATREMDALLKAVRANPKKYLSIKLAIF
jgi:phospholipid/cholesterol/gamma-HCH transport system substrate-binding protein